jgi:hypothetical protein
LIGCKPYYDLALQYQFYHEQQALDALESKLGVGMSCPVQANNRSHQLIFDVGVLSNLNLRSTRPGGDRDGWQANFIWRVEVGDGEFVSQLNYAEIDDQETYSPILANGASRSIQRSFVLLQYRRPYSRNMTFQVNLFHREQSSNIELFTSTESSIEVGFGLAF